MDETRQSPEKLLKIINDEKKKAQRGHLKIFFGYAAGVGKTYAMLEAAHEAENCGIDTVIGYIEPHARPKTAALTKGLECLLPLEIKHGGITLHELDIDAALKRHPKILLVDELAHSNAEGCRHTKRYQDIEEILNSGIDVYTTLNVQHIESLNDTVASVTKVFVRERIPDSFFDKADQVELVDIEPEDLIKRLNSGDVYKEEQAVRAVQNFFTIENLTALREIALRRCADRVNIINENARLKIHGDYHTDEHILVCLSSSPSNAKIIRNAARMANAFKANFTALFVETPDFKYMSDSDRERLRANIHLAKQLGAETETAYGDDIALQISEFARLSGISKIVIGRSAAGKRHIFGKASLTEKLISTSPNLDVYIIPDRDSGSNHRLKQFYMKNKPVFSLSDIFKSLLILVISSLIGMMFKRFGFDESNIITVYVLGVLITSIITKNRIYSLISSVVSVLVFNFLFTEPLFSLQAYGKGYPVTFVIMFVSAFITGSLAGKLKNHAKHFAQSAYRTELLFDTNRLLQKATTRDEIITAASEQTAKLLERDVIFYLNENDSLSEPKTFPYHSEFDEKCISDNERTVAEWVLKNNKHAGATTQTLSAARCLYLAVRVNEDVYGVVGIVIDGRPLDSFENSILLSILGECALSLENEKNIREKQEAAVLAKNEQLRANLLRAISHDLRTPLTSVSGNAGNLLYNGDSLDEATKKQIYTDIYDDSMWLINLVENLLSVTRLNENRLNLNISTELVSDIVEEALHHVGRKKAEHSIIVEHENEFLLARADARLIVQVIINLVDNAVKYTNPGSEIKIKTKEEQGKAVISVSDNGEGIPDEMKPRIFDMFCCGTNRIADSRRSLGLGLSLCKSIVTAHGGEITVKDNKPHGTEFSFTLPIGEVNLHE